MSSCDIDYCITGTFLSMLVQSTDITACFCPCWSKYKVCLHAKHVYPTTLPRRERASLWNLVHHHSSWKIWSLPYLYTFLAYESPISENPPSILSPCHPCITSALSPICTTSFRSNLNCDWSVLKSHFPSPHHISSRRLSQERESPDNGPPLSFVFLYLHYHFRISTVV